MTVEAPRRTWLRDAVLTRDTARGLPIGLWCGLFIAASVVLVALIGAKPVVTASIEGVTETIELETLARELHWTLPGFRLIECGAAADATMDGMELVIRGGARIRVDRPEGGTGVKIDVSALDSAAPSTDCGAPLPVDLVAADGSVRHLTGAHVRFVRNDALPNKSSVAARVAVLPLHARVSVGEELGEGVDRMLLKGSVTIHAEQSRASMAKLFAFLHRKRTYTGESVVLARGDRVLPPGPEAVEEASPGREEVGAAARAVSARDASEHAANGYLRLVPNDAIQFAFNERTDRVVIQRAGNATVEVDLSFWQRLENEPALTGIIAFLVTLVALVDLFTRFLDFAEWYGRSRRGADGLPRLD